MDTNWPDLSQDVPSSKGKPERSSSFARVLKLQTNALPNMSSKMKVTSSNNEDSKLLCAAVTDSIVSEKITDSGGENWKEAQKLRREEKKWEKKLRREEELRRQRIAPKGSKIQVISTNLISNSSTATPTPAVSVAPELIEFPALGSPVTSRPKQQEQPSPTAATPSRNTDKRPNAKRHDPIIVDLHQMVVPHTKKQASTRHENKAKTKHTAEILSGNPLDSSQPIRHRGKVREKPKPKRPTPLKSVIVQHRIAKKFCTQENDGVLSEIEVAEVNKISELSIACQQEETDVEVASKDVNVECTSNIPSSLCDMSKKDAIHSRRFREYCDHMRSQALDESAKMLLKQLVLLQDKAHAKNPDKSKVRRRFIAGLHEARKFLILKKALFLIIAPDLEKCPQPGGLDSKIFELIELAKKGGVPYAFCLGRKKLGYVVMKQKGVSCVVILNTDGVETEFSSMKSQIIVLRDDYMKAISTHNAAAPEVEATTSSDVNKQVVSSLLSALEESLQTPKHSLFLKAIECAGDSD